MTEAQRAALDAGRAQFHERIKRKHALIRLGIETLALAVTVPRGRGRPVIIADLMTRRMGMPVTARHVRRVLADLDLAA